MNIVIEKSVAMPKPRTKSTSTEMGTHFKAMEIGDSFLWEKRSVSNLYLYAKLAGVKIAVRMVDGKKRVWRTA